MLRNASFDAVRYTVVTWREHEGSDRTIEVC